MTLGEKLRQARLELGLSQRQLCGEKITRNMLSQIEHGTARPSMDTLEYLAKALGKSVGYFLDEENAALPNLRAIRRGRECWEKGDFPGVIRALEDYRGPDEVFDREKALLTGLACLAQAEEAITQERLPYARAMLAQAGDALALGYEIPELGSRRKLLLIRAGATEETVGELPRLDDELLARAEMALQRDPERCMALLGAVENREKTYLLLGRAELALGHYDRAAQWLLRTGEESRTAQMLEICYREMGDFQKAYYYACKQREKG